MRYSPFALFLIAAVSLVGCQMSSGILAAGPNTYTVTERFSPTLGGSMKAQSVALAEANAYCKSQGREMMPLDLKELRGLSDPNGPQTGYSATFRCLLLHRSGVSSLILF